jgi:adenylate cyclase
VSGPVASGDQRLARDLSRRLWIYGWIANTIGAAVVFMAIGFLLAVFFNAAERDALGRENLPVVIGSVLFLGIALTLIRDRKFSRALAWLEEGRDPTEQEHRLTLTLPAQVAALTAAGWGVGSVIGFAFNLDHSLLAATLIAVAVWLGGETTSAIAYLVSEWKLRPLTARALAIRNPEDTILGVRNRQLFAWSLGTAVPMTGVICVGVVGLTKDGVDPSAIAAACVFLSVVSLATGLLSTMITARAIARPLTEMHDAVGRIAAGDLGARLAIDDSTEVGLLQAGFNRMAEGLRERERIRDLFGRQVGRDVARAALAGGTRLGGEEREVGALFVDLTGSTSMAAAMPPTEVVRLLNRFFRVVIEVVESQGGFVNKFEGDAALCVFGAPAPCADPAGQALCAARTLAERLDREVPEVGFGIGVSVGHAVAGNVGSEERFEYTVIGDPVNEAARLCDLAKQSGRPALASDKALDGTSSAEAERWERGERTVLRGRLEATELAWPRAVPARERAGVP